MKILVTNDDGILSPGLWTLVKELKNIAEVVVAAPDREQSAIGTAVTLRQPLRVQRTTPLVPDVEAYSIEGTPGDSVILALGKLVKDADMVVSGINNGLNLGEDVLISGTVGAALQGYLRGLSAIAISMEYGSIYAENAAKVAALLAQKVYCSHLPVNLFLNVNVPNLPLTQIKGAKVTRLASKSHIDTVDQGHDGRREYYWLVRRQKLSNHLSRETDIGAVENGDISITALSITLPDKPPSSILNSLSSNFLRDLMRGGVTAQKAY
jgi:5'-nucleotidase